MTAPSLADARRRAEDALRRVLANAAAIVRLSWSDGATAADRRNLERIKTAAADIAQDHKILRALLAALPAEGEALQPDFELPHDPDPNCPDCGGKGYTLVGPERLVNGCRCNWTPIKAPAPTPAPTTPTRRNRERAEHILNHYDRKSSADTFCLARRLDADDAEILRSRPLPPEVEAAAEALIAAVRAYFARHSIEFDKEGTSRKLSLALDRMIAALSSARGAKGGE